MRGHAHYYLFRCVADRSDFQCLWKGKQWSTWHPLPPHLNFFETSVTDFREITTRSPKTRKSPLYTGANTVKSIRVELTSGGPSLASSSRTVCLGRNKIAMLGRRHRNSVAEEGGRNMGRTWTEDGKRRQPLQSHFINSAVISIEDAKEPRVPLASDVAICGALPNFPCRFWNLRS